MVLLGLVTFGERFASFGNFRLFANALITGRLRNHSPSPDSELELLKAARRADSFGVRYIVWEAWLELAEKDEDTLMNLVASAVESKAGV